MASAILCFSTVFLLCLTVEAQQKINVWGVDMDVPVDCDEIPQEYAEKYENHFAQCNEKLDIAHTKIMEKFVQQKILNKLVPETEVLDSELSDEFIQDDECEYQKSRNCCSESKVVRPYYGKKGEDVVIVLQAMLFTQNFKVTRCTQYEGECFSDLGLDMKNIKTSCVTDYGSTHLLVYNPKTNKTDSLRFHVPVSCSCHARF